MNHKYTNIIKCINTMNHSVVEGRAAVMTTQLHILLLLCLAVSQGHCWWFSKTEPTEVCCEDFPDHCFNRNYPFNEMPLPECFLPKFKLFTGSTGSLYSDGITISSSNISSKFSPHKKTIIIVHGYNDKPQQGNYWMIKSMANLINKFDVNVILADWNSNSAKSFWNYDLAASNARVAGRGIRDLVRSLYNKGLSRYNTYCVGHSLGAQVCGYAGQYLGSSKFARITGLDPAGPEFLGLPASGRLDKTDADFVDVIHTAGGSSYLFDYGFLPPVGHIDFYPNGGKLQPGCHNKKRTVRSVDQIKAKLDALKAALENQQLVEEKKDKENVESADVSPLRRKETPEASVRQNIDNQLSMLSNDASKNSEKAVENSVSNNEPELADTSSILTRIKDFLKRLQNVESDGDTEARRLELSSDENQVMEKELDIGQNDLITELQDSNGAMDKELRENIDDFVKENSVLRDIQTLIDKRVENGINLDLSDKEKAQISTALDRMEKGFVASFLSCSHGLATDYFVASINSQCFKALGKCSFTNNQLHSCYYCHGCPVMGYYADLYKQYQGVYYLRTNGNPPYCKS